MRSLIVVALVCTGACQKSEPAAPEPAVVVPEAVEPEPVRQETRSDYVVTTASLRRQPTRDRKLDIDGKKVSNWQATLHRGEQVTVLETNDDWLRVRTSAETEGWLSAASLLGEESAQPATILAPAQTFARPDLVSVSGDAIPAGTLLFVTDEKAQFSRVDAPKRRAMWIESSALVTAATEVAASRLVTRVHALEAKGDKEAAANREMLETQFGDTRLVRALRGDAEPAAIERPLEPGTYEPEDGRRDYRFQLGAADGTGVSLRLMVNGDERCSMEGRVDSSVHKTRAGKVRVNSPCVVKGAVENESQVRLRLVGYVLKPDGGRVDVDESTHGSLEDVFDADIDIDADGSVQFVLAVACPWVWVTEDGDTWQRRVEIIQNLNARAKETSQRVSLGRVRIIDGEVRLQIREEKRETSHLDTVALEVAGRVIPASVEPLARVDGRYRILRYGERVELYFDVGGQGMVDAWVHASGYYLADRD